MKKSNYSTFILILLLSQKIYGATTELDGIWKGTSAHTFFGLSFTYNFKGDSVFITDRFCNDVPDPCHYSRCYNTFFTCTFKITKDSLLIKGHCADSTFKVNTNNTGCRFGPTEVCDFSLNKRFHVLKDTLFLSLCDEDCAEKLIKENSGVNISRKGQSPLSDQAECILQNDNKKLVIKIPLNQPLYDLKIVTTQGKVIYRKSFISRNELCGTFSPGVYLLSAKSSTGKTIKQTVRIGG
jgi:hypothetical protein